MINKPVFNEEFIDKLTTTVITIKLGSTYRLGLVKTVALDGLVEIRLINGKTVEYPDIFAALDSGSAVFLNRHDSKRLSDVFDSLSPDC